MKFKPLHGSDRGVARRRGKRRCWRDHHPGYGQGETHRRGKLSPSVPASDKDGNLILLDVKAGDRVLFSKWAGTEFKLDGQEHMIMKEDDILAGIIES